MKRYLQIHIWEFPPTKTFISLNPNFRNTLFDLVRKNMSYQKLAEIVNEKSVLYREKTKFNASHICSWKAGYKNKKNNKKSKIHIPLWTLIEISKLISADYKKFLLKAEKNIGSYTSRGRGKSINNPKLPLELTPEMVSVIFNLCGDGHIGKKEDYSSYRQVKKEGLDCFTKKLENVFGKFDVSVFEGSKLLIPKIITDFYQYYFGLNTLEWNIARIPDKIKNMPKEFLIAGLASFIVDEGHISDTIEIYSKNKELISDIKEISIKLGYKIYGPKEKYRYGKLDCYRIYISVTDAQKLFNDVLEVSKDFSTCQLAHKMPLLETIVKRQKRSYKKTSHGSTKAKILEMVQTGPKRVNELASALNIGHAAVREHVNKMVEMQQLIKRQVENKHYILVSKN